MDTVSASTGAGLNEGFVFLLLTRTLLRFGRAKSTTTAGK